MYHGRICTSTPGIVKIQVCIHCTRVCICIQVPGDRNHRTVFRKVKKVLLSFRVRPSIESQIPGYPGYRYPGMNTRGIRKQNVRFPPGRSLHVHDTRRSLCWHFTWMPGRYLPEYRYPYQGAPVPSIGIIGAIIIRIVPLSGCRVQLYPGTL